MQLQNVIVDDCQGAITRAKIKNIELGEKSTKYFFNLEKHRQKCHTIKMLKCDNGVQLTKSEDIADESRCFYSKLYTNEDCDSTVQNSFIDNIESSLPTGDIDWLNSPLNHDDLCKALNKMENNKSPGTDGLTSEFFKHFYNELGPILLKLASLVYKTGTLPETMTQSIITLVPKKGDLSVLQNWRPISLLNVDFKIISKALATKLSTVMGHIISPDQTCCIPGRDISDNVMAMRDLVSFITEKDLNGFLIKIDQQKAFDRVDHEYLFKVLEKFKFPEYFINWIKIFYDKPISCVKVNGFMSDYFDVKRGIRQGCPLSALLYVISSEPVRNLIVNHPSVKGFEVMGSKALFFQHADDSTAFVRDIKSVDIIFECFKEYNRASGSKVNIEKSEVLPLGPAIHNPPINLDVEVITGPVKILGLYIGDPVECEKENWNCRVDKCLKLLNMWKMRGLTLKGKVLVVNSLIISSMVYTLNLSHLPIWVKSRLKEAVVDFIWSGNRPRIKYDVLITSVKSGGLGLLDIERMKCALRCKYIKKIFDIEHPLNPVTRSLLLYNLNNSFSLDSDIFRIRMPVNIKGKLNSFSREIINAWERVNQNVLAKPKNAAELLSQPLMCNPFICNNDGPINRVEFFNSELCRVKDIVYEYVPGFLPSESIIQLMSPVTCSRNLEKMCNSIINSIPGNWKHKINSVALADVVSNSSIHVKSLDSSESIDIVQCNTSFFNHFMRKIDEQSTTPAGLDHWRQFFGHNISIPFHSCFGGLKENYMGEIDYLLAHNSLYTNEKLCNLSINVDKLCSFCSGYVESAYHLFAKCSFVQDLLYKVKIICQRIIDKDISSDLFTMYAILGYHSSSNKKAYHLVNFVISNYHFSVWCGRKWKRTRENISLERIFKAFIKKRLELEYKSNCMNNSVQSFYDKFGYRDVLATRSQDGFKLTF